MEMDCDGSEFFEKIDRDDQHRLTYLAPSNGSVINNSLIGWYPDDLRVTLMQITIIFRGTRLNTMCTCGILQFAFVTN